MSIQNPQRRGVHIPDKHDWLEHFDQKDGNYQHKCDDCKVDYIGHKDTLVCRDCAYLKLCRNARGAAVKIANREHTIEVLETIAADLNKYEQGGQCWNDASDQLFDYFAAKDLKKAGGS